MKKIKLDDIEKKWHEATIQNNFIFGKTMEIYPELCRKLIEIILKIKVLRIDYPEREKNIELRTDSKGVRLDVYVQDKNCNRSFNLEMQISDIDNLAKRMRYYQSLIDLDNLKHGKHYNSLGESYIIFICPFDKFQKGRHMYTFQNRCKEDTSLFLEDGAVKIFLSTKGKMNDVDQELKNFLNYVDSGIVNGAFTKNLNDAVQAIKYNEKARLEYMTYQMALLESRLEGEARGREEGREEGRMQMIKNLLLADTPIDYIVKATGWSKEKILSILEEPDFKN